MANDIDKTSPHYKGEFGSIYEVNQKFPSGGVEGDYVAIDGWAHYWNADRGTWCVNAQRDSYWDELITGIIEKFKLFKGATYMGVAGLDTVPAKAIGAKMYYFATVAGTYKNFGGLVVPQGINVLYSENGSSWVCSTLLEVAQELGVSTRMVVSQKVVNDALNLKANQSSVNEALAKKADKETVDIELGKKANTADVNTKFTEEQKRVDAELDKKFDKESIAQESGNSEVLVMSQKAVSDKLSNLSVGLESFKGKTILCLGDSITHDGAYTTPLSSLLDAKIINRGSSGSSIAIKGNNISFVERVQLPQSDESGTALGMPTKADVVIFYGGVNDWMASSVDFGTTKEGENTDTFCGSVFLVFNKLKQYYPNASFFVVNNYNVYSPNVFPSVSEIKYADNEDGVYEYVRNTQGKTFDDYRNAIIEISKLFGFKMIDLKNVGFSFFKKTDREKYSFLNNGNYDGLHPNEESGKLMAKHMAKQMCNTVTVQKELEGSLGEVESSNDKLFLSTGLFKTISNSYVEEDGSITQYNGWKRTSYIRCDTAKYIIIHSSIKDSKYNAFYDKDKKFISTFFTAYWNDNTKEAGNRNVIKVPDGACYYIVSNTNAGFEGTVIKNSFEYDPISSSRIYDVYIASRDSKYVKFADYVTDGVNDQDMINSIISDSGVNSIYIYGDSTFLLSAPIKVKDNFKIKSNGATFNNIDMITHQIVSSVTSGNQVVLDSTEGFRIGMYLYFEDEKGSNDWNVITRIDKTTPPKVTLKNNIKNVWDKANNPVVKSANMCTLLDKVQNVEIDGVVVDWNVDNNPIQKYNPWYVQEGITISESK